MRHPLLRKPRIAFTPNRLRVWWSHPGIRWAGTIGGVRPPAQASGSRVAHRWAEVDRAVATLHAREGSDSAHARLRPGPPVTPRPGGRRPLRAKAVPRAGRASRWVKPWHRESRRPPVALGCMPRLRPFREPIGGRLAGHKACRPGRALGWYRFPRQAGSGSRRARRDRLRSASRLLSGSGPRPGCSCRLRGGRRPAPGPISIEARPTAPSRFRRERLPASPPGKSRSARVPKAEDSVEAWDPAGLTPAGKR